MDKNRDITISKNKHVILLNIQEINDIYSLFAC